MSRAIVIILIVLFLSGCQSDSGHIPVAGSDESAVSSTSTSKNELVEPTATKTRVPAATETKIQDRVVTTASATQTNAPGPSLTMTPAATTTAAPTVDRSHEAAAELAQAVPPARDDLRLAEAFNGLDRSTLSTPPPRITGTLARGTRRTFKVLDVVNNTIGEIEAELFEVGEHAYFWFETEPFGIIPGEDLLSIAVSSFDESYDGVTDTFGKEESPGIDGDTRLHVLHASPQTICGVTPDGEGSCGTAGFVSSADLQPAILNPQSNEHEMFIMNDRQFGSDYYLGVLAHELRHLVEFNYDLSDTDWAKEGSAVLAAELVGFPSGGVQRANEFLANPDQQLNSWPETGKGPYYGQGYLFNRYIYDRLGEAMYREFATSPLPGFMALDDLANRQGLNFTSETIWLDWLAALAVHDHPQVAQKYQLAVDGLETAAYNTIEESPSELTGDVRQYAADYYELPPGTVNIAFAGTESVPLLAGQDLTENTFWYAQRANYSNPRLTGQIDLSEVQSATLAYDVYADIEKGWDFAYVSASIDGGKTWEPLTATNMQGLDPADDPSESALAPRYYTGRTQEWRHEIIDLTRFAGQEVLLRFEMVTDPILTYSGLAVDNVAVPEIRYFDDESREGWTAEGFTLASASLPQPWHLQLVEYTADGPVVKQLTVNDNGTAKFTSTVEEGQEQSILIVAASAPMTLEPAGYTITITK